MVATIAHVNNFKIHGKKKCLFIFMKEVDFIFNI